MTEFCKCGNWTRWDGIELCMACGLPFPLINPEALRMYRVVSADSVSIFHPDKESK
jgi:hypothetical protein